MGAAVVAVSLVALVEFAGISVDDGTVMVVFVVEVGAVLGLLVCAVVVVSLPSGVVLSVVGFDHVAAVLLAFVVSVEFASGPVDVLGFWDAARYNRDHRPSKRDT